MLTRIEGLLAEVGLADEELIIRMTGCPNGCVRPYTAEIGIVGRSVDLYAILLGASHMGTRLGLVFAENVPRREIAQRDYADESFVVVHHGQAPHLVFGHQALREALARAEGLKNVFVTSGGLATMGFAPAATAFTNIPYISSVPRRATVR